MNANVTHMTVNASDAIQADEKQLSNAIQILLPQLASEEYSSSGDGLILPQDCELRPAQRLVVLVPENEFNEIELARRLWRMAAPGSLSILFLSVATGPDTEAYLIRRLSTLAAITGDEQVQISIKVASENWIEMVESVLRPGDHLLCYDRQSSSNWGIERKNPGLQISRELNVPVYFLAGLKLGPSLRQQKFIKDSVSWITSMIVLVAFGWLQIQFVRATEGWISTVVMILTVVVEIMLLSVLNHLTS